MYASHVKGVSALKRCVAEAATTEEGVGKEVGPVNDEEGEEIEIEEDGVGHDHVRDLVVVDLLVEIVEERRERHLGPARQEGEPPLVRKDPDLGHLHGELVVVGVRPGVVEMRAGVVVVAHLHFLLLSLWMPKGSVMLTTELTRMYCENRGITQGKSIARNSKLCLKRG